MQLGNSADQEQLTADIQAFLAAWPPVGVDLSAYFPALAERGWSAPGWPQRWQGGGFSQHDAFLIERMLGLAGAPMLGFETVHQVGPLLLSLDDEDVCRRYLPAMAQGRISWALHHSLAGGDRLVGRFLESGFQAEVPSGLVYGARSATGLLALVTDGDQTALAVAELAQASVQPNLPLDPDTVALRALEFEILAVVDARSALAERVAQGGWRYSGLPCLSGRLRYRLQALFGGTDGGADAELAQQLAALEVTLSGLEVLEQRALQAADESLTQAVHIRAREVGRSLAECQLEQLGYYQLAAPDPTRQHNELPGQALAAQDAMAELIRYLEGDSAAARDRLAQSLGLF